MKRSAVLLGILLTLTGCGGGGGSSEEPASTMLSGKAAAGAAIIGQVVVKGSNGNSLSTVIEADGSYAVDVSTLVAPYMLRAVGSVGGKEYKLHSFAEAADVGGTVNVTPFTNLIIENVAQGLASSHFDNGNFSHYSPAEIAVQAQALKAKLSNVFTALGISPAIDLLRTSFSTNHSGLDAALDMIRIETNPSTNIATITNFIDGQSIEDDMNALDDEVAPLPVAENLSAAQLDLLAMANRVSALTNLFSAELPSVEQLGALFADDTLNNDSGKAEFLTEISNDPSLIGISFANVTYEEYDQSAGTSIVQFSVTRNSVTDPEPVRWYMAKNNNVWQFRGDQEIADIWFGFICNYRLEYTSIGCGVNVGVEDNDFSNTPNAAGTPIASARMTILREGEPVENSQIYLGLPDGYTTGELQIYDDDYGDDYMGFGSSWSEISASVFQAGDVAQIELFTEALDISDAQNPQIDPSATAVQTVTRPVIAAPVSSASASMFPTISAATRTALDQYSDGNLAVEWTVPTGITIDEVWFEARQDENDVRVDDRNVSGSSGTTTMTLDTSSLGTLASNFSKDLRVYGKNASGQNFLTSYDYQGIAEVEEEEETQEGSVLSSLVGTWEFVGEPFSREGYNATFLTLTATGEFFFFNRDDSSTDSCREVGYEYGTYSSTAEAISLSKVIDTNGCIGIFDSGNSGTLTIVDTSSNTVIINAEDDFGNITMQRVVASEDSIVGAWHEPLDSIEGNGLSFILLLLEDGIFFSMDANPSTPTENDFSYGDYTFNASTEQLVLTDVFNAEGITGDGVNTLNAVISENKLIFNSDDADFLNRVFVNSVFSTDFLSDKAFSLSGDLAAIERLAFSSDGTGSIKFVPDSDNGFDDNDINGISWEVTSDGTLEFRETDGYGDYWDWVFEPSAVSGDQASFDFTYTGMEDGSPISGSGSGSMILE